jgi:hypothetical protein
VSTAGTVIDGVRVINGTPGNDKIECIGDATHPTVVEAGTLVNGLAGNDSIDIRFALGTRVPCKAADLKIIHGIDAVGDLQVEPRCVRIAAGRVTGS